MATQVLEYRLEVDESSLKAECYFPGMTYDDFDRAGKSFVLVPLYINLYILIYVIYAVNILKLIFNL